MRLLLIVLITCQCNIITRGQSPCPSPSIYGQLTYDNIYNTPLDGSMIYLVTTGSVILDSCLINSHSEYRFCAVPEGNYTIYVKTPYPWGGVSMADALLLLKHYVEISPLSGTRLTAGDIDTNGHIIARDALLTARRIIQLDTSFPAGDWVFDQPTISVTDTSSQCINLKALCTGDVDASYTPDIQTFAFCGDTLTDPRDHQKYPTIQLGNQCWMKRNLNIGAMIYSTTAQAPHSDCSNNGIIEKYCYNNNPINCEVYGGLYDWNEMMNYSPQIGGQGICPEGWHLPTNEEWCTMATLLDPTVNCSPPIYTGLTIGGKLKESGTAHWDYPNTGASNESGFTAFGFGNRTTNGGFGSINRYGNYWSSSYGVSDADIYWWGPQFNANSIVIGKPSDLVIVVKNGGLGIRCIKY